MLRTMRPGLLGLTLVFFPFFTLAQDKAPAEISPESVQKLARQVFVGDPALRAAALEALEERGNPDVVPALIQALRFVPDRDDINATLVALVGEQPGSTWHDWMLWQEAHTEIEPFAGFDAFKADVFSHIDPNFRLFTEPRRRPRNPPRGDCLGRRAQGRHPGLDQPLPRRRGRGHLPAGR